ncbi:MAG: aminopeptidase [Clostridia bacterium]|nr:aminopeptidase [Clostridia bacterium]
MDREKLIKYVDLLLHTGVALEKGQPLIINGNTENYEFIQLLAQRAYVNGASDVEVIYNDDVISRLKYEYADVKEFEEVPAYKVEPMIRCAQRGGAIIHVRSSDPDNLSGIDTEKIKAFTKANAETQAPWRKVQHETAMRSTIAAVPGEKWAKKVFPDAENPIEAMWDAIFSCSYADKEDPVAYWKEHTDAIVKRCNILTEMELTQLHFTSSNGTDLVIELAEDCVWGGGGNTTPAGVFYTPNIPTQESFTCPHKHKVNGTVVATKPLSYGGGLIDNFSITFKDGAAVSWKAEKGENILATIIENDEGSKYLGEVALVNFTSPINMTGRLFYNTLYDENAVCHLALGNGYPFTVPGENKEEKGLNKSKLHVDFMFGAEDTLCIGTKKDGSKVTIMKDGNIVI